MNDLDKERGEAVLLDLVGSLTRDVEELRREVSGLRLSVAKVERLERRVGYLEKHEELLRLGVVDLNGRVGGPYNSAHPALFPKAGRPGLLEEFEELGRRLEVLEGERRGSNSLPPRRCGMCGSAERFVVDSWKDLRNGTVWGVYCSCAPRVFLGPTFDTIDEAKAYLRGDS